MTWTPIITSAMFDGPRADLMTAVSALMGFSLIILAVGLIWRIFR